MKKLFIVILFLLIAAVAFGRENSKSALVDKGNISLILNDKKIDLPITFVSIRKDDNTVLTARAEKNDDEIQKLISLELTFENKAFSDKKDPKEIRLEVISRNKYQTDGEQLSIHYPPGNDKKEISYTVYNKGERMNLNLSSFQMSFKVENINYGNGALRISGRFSAEYKSSLKQGESNNSVQVKDGKFEIII